MIYKGYEGHVRFDEDAGIFTGEVINTRDVITFQGASVKEIKKAFEESVDDYLEFCANRGEAPEKPFSGTLSLRMSPELHRRTAAAAYQCGKSINAYIVDQLQAKTELPRLVKVDSQGGRFVLESALEGHKAELDKIEAHIQDLRERLRRPAASGQRTAAIRAGAGRSRKRSSRVRESNV